MPLSGIHLTPQLVQAVRDAVEIVEIAGEHTKLRRSGQRYSGLCPLHKEKTPSFSVDAEQGLYYCFGCGRGGDAIRLHMELTGDDFPAAIDALAHRYGIPLPATPAAAGKRRPDEPDLEPVLRRAEAYFESQLEQHDLPQEYLRKRRISAELIAEFHLGFAPAGWQNLLDALSGEVPSEQLEAAGVVGRARESGRPYDRFRCRLIFPIRNGAGRLVGFGGRALDDDKAKYVNTPETSRFQKRSLLYGLDRAKRAAREGGRLVVVEGYFDLLAMRAAGVEAVVAGMGTSLTQEQARLAARFCDETILAYDGDTAGAEAARRALPVLLAAGVAVREARLAEGEDPDTLRLEAGEEALADAVEEAPDLAVSEIQRLTPSRVHREPRERAAALDKVAELLGAIADDGLRRVYALEAAARLGLPASEILRRRPQRGDRSETGVPERSDSDSPVYSAEERVLELLLHPGTQLPPAEELPSAEVFFEPTWRNIYAAYCALYREGGEAPEPRALLASLGEEAAGLDRISRIVLESAADPGTGSLEQALLHLEGRWLRQRLRELAHEIQDAERSGDPARVDELLAQKAAASASLRAGKRADPGS